MLSRTSQDLSMRMDMLATLPFDAGLSHAANFSVIPTEAKRSGATVLLGASPVIGRAQGWRSAPPPSAAAALTPSAPRADELPGRRRPRRRLGSGDGVLGRIPFLASCQHGVEDDDQLAPAGDQSDLGFLASGDEPLIIGLE